MSFTKKIKALLPHGIIEYRQKNHQYRLQAETYSQWIKKGDLVFDVGANIGNRVKVFRALDARVIAFEPQSICVNHLNATFSRDPSVIIRHCGLAATPGELKMHLASDNAMSTFSQEFIDDAKANSRFQGVKWDKTETVKLSTLDAEIQEYGQPKFIKIDVEGFEATVLSGLSKPVACISFEWTPERKESTRACILRCIEIGMTEFNISFGEGLTLNFNQWVEVETMLLLTSMLSENNSIFGDIYARQPSKKNCIS